MTIVSSTADSPSQSPEPAVEDRAETAEHRRDRYELIQLLAMAHRRLDALGVPRINRN